MNSVDYEQAYKNGWNNTGVPPGGKYYFKVRVGVVGLKMTWSDIYWIYAERYVYWS